MNVIAIRQYCAFSRKDTVKELLILLKESLKCPVNTTLSGRDSQKPKTH